MRIVIDTNDLEDGDIEIFKKEVKKTVGMEILIGRPLSEKQSEIARTFRLVTKDFKVSFDCIGGK